MNQPLIRVQDVMTTDGYVVLDGLHTVEEGIKALKSRNAQALIIQKRHENDELGIVVLADIAEKVISVNLAPERINLYEIMSKPVVSVPASMDVRYCARLFNRLGLSSAPVMEQGKMIGMVSYSEIVLGGLCADT